MNIAVILAGGSGTRMGTAVPKQFLEVRGKPVLAYTYEAFQRAKEIDMIIAVSPLQHIQTATQIGEEYGIDKLRAVIAGGATRRESSYIAVQYLAEAGAHKDDIVLIHDAVRPNIDERIINENIATARDYGACITAVATKDTIAVSENGSFVDEIPKRDKLWCVQTPQSFRYSVIENAHNTYEASLASGAEMPEVTDDAGLVMSASNGTYRIGICKGDYGNIKITTPEDIRILLSIPTFE